MSVVDYVSGNSTARVRAHATFFIKKKKEKSHRNSIILFGSVCRIH